MKKGSEPVEQSHVAGSRSDYLLKADCASEPASDFRHATTNTLLADAAIVSASQFSESVCKVKT